MTTEIKSQKSEVNAPPEIEQRAPDVRSFRDLKVYQDAYRVSPAIHRATLSFPKMEQYALAGQMRRASKSICDNLAEGFAKQRSSSPEFRRFVMIAIGSSDEMKVWLDYSRDLGYVEATQVKAWQSEYTDISRMLHGLIKSWN